MWSMGNLRGKGSFLKGEFRFSPQSVVVSARCMGRFGSGLEERGVEGW